MSKVQIAIWIKNIPYVSSQQSKLMMVAKISIVSLSLTCSLPKGFPETRLFMQHLSKHVFRESITCYFNVDSKNAIEN